MITVVIATRNRAALLAECLDSLAAQKADCDWRVIVVDNGSTDATPSVARAARCPRLSCVVEPEPGASRARNRGAAEASTPYVLFVDDECTFPPGYIARACAIAATSAPICFGGPILARYHQDAPPPLWFKPEYGAFSLPENNPPDRPPRLSAGNMAVHRETLLRLGGFPECYGPAAGRMAYGEENALIATIARELGSGAFLYDGHLVNHHLVKPEKFRWREIVRESYRRGLARGRLAAAGLQERPTADEGASVMSAGPATLARHSILDLTMLRLLTDVTTFACWQQVVYERWMKYVTMLGVVIGKLLGR